MRGNMRRDKGGLEVNEYMYSNTKYKGMFPEVDILRLLRVSKHGCQTIHYRSIGWNAIPWPWNNTRLIHVINNIISTSKYNVDLCHKIYIRKTKSTKESSPKVFKLLIYNWYAPSKLWRGCCRKIMWPQPPMVWLYKMKINELMSRMVETI